MAWGKKRQGVTKLYSFLLSPTVEGFHSLNTAMLFGINTAKHRGSISYSSSSLRCAQHQILEINIISAMALFPRWKRAASSHNFESQRRRDVTCLQSVRYSCATEHQTQQCMKVRFRCTFLSTKLPTCWLLCKKKNYVYT